ncbi:hypothetical protein [Prochlorothrix hollandica]|uniref:hypothetical protein n=1 Tax=Prochlorothrix hollandica TaxID=1223 RepID=UPI000344A6FB|nr:hypothetical protein [Prochlorothrix hollandica]
MTASLSPSQRQHLYYRLGCGEDTPIDLCQRWQIQEFVHFGSILRIDAQSFLEKYDDDPTPEFFRPSTAAPCLADGNPDSALAPGDH